MTAGLKSRGMMGSIATLLASGALLVPAATPAQAMPSAATCGGIWASAQLAFANHRWDQGMAFLERYVDVGCTGR